jgi:hypothetical protein
MSAPPLTHHEILELAAPFTRRGRHVDLAASNRLERRLEFKPPAGTPSPARLPSSAWRESLQLESFGTGTFRLTRVLSQPSERANGVAQARLQAMGPDPGELLARVEAFAPERQFDVGSGFLIARSYSLETAGRGGPAVAVLTDASVEVEGLTLKILVSPVRRVAAELTLMPAPDVALDLPEDLLAVLGWDWARLIPADGGWKSKLRLRGHAAKRTRVAERALAQAAAHLERTLAESPQSFHERLRAARWGVFFRRAIPSLTFVLLLIAVASLAHRGVGRGSELWVLFFHVPTALIAISFCLQELPQYEIPPLPRRPKAVAWRIRGGTPTD